MQNRKCTSLDFKDATLSSRRQLTDAAKYKKSGLFKPLTIFQQLFLILQIILEIPCFRNQMPIALNRSITSQLNPLHFSTIDVTLHYYFSGFPVCVLCVTVCYCVLLYVTVCYCMLLYVTYVTYVTLFYCALLCVTVRYCVLPCVTVHYCSLLMLLHVTVRYCMLMFVTVCHPVLLALLCVTACYCALLCVTVSYCVLLCVIVCYCSLLCVTVCYCVLLFFTVCYRELLCVTVHYCVLLFVTVCYCVLLSFSGFTPPHVQSHLTSPITFPSPHFKIFVTRKADWFTCFPLPRQSLNTANANCTEIWQFLHRTQLNTDRVSIELYSHPAPLLTSAAKHNFCPSCSPYCYPISC